MLDNFCASYGGSGKKLIQDHKAELDLHLDLMMIHMQISERQIRFRGLMAFNHEMLGTLRNTMTACTSEQWLLISLSCCRYIYAS